MNAVDADPYIKKTVRIYYLFQFTFSLLIWVPIFYEYQRVHGLTDPQIFKIQSLYYLFFCLFEIPTGLFADRFGTQKSMQLGAITLVACNLMPIFWTNYTGFLTHFILIALARSLISGASSAYLYEHLQSKGFSDQYRYLEGRARSLGLLGKVVCWSMVGYLMKWNITLPYWTTVVSSILSVYFGFKLPKPKPKDDEKIDSNQRLFFKRFAEVFLTIYQRPVLFFVMIQGIGVFVLARICQVNLFQPILNMKGFHIQTHGLLMGLMTVFEAIGSLNLKLPMKLDVLKSNPKSKMILYTAMISLSLSGIAYGYQWATVIGLSIFSFGVGIASVVQSQIMNDTINQSHVRATLLSVESIIDRAICAIVAYQLGSVVANGQINTFIYISSAIAFALVVISYYSMKIFQNDRDRIII